MSGLADALSQLPLILRCTVVGCFCFGAIAALATVVNVINHYPLENVVQAALFGIVEAFVLAGIVGACAGLVVGLFAYLVRGAMRRRA